jgi:hypothetical protein
MLQWCANAAARGGCACRVALGGPAALHAAGACMCCAHVLQPATCACTGVLQKPPPAVRPAAVRAVARWHRLYHNGWAGWAGLGCRVAQATPAGCGRGGLGIAAGLIVLALGGGYGWAWCVSARSVVAHSLVRSGGGGVGAWYAMAAVTQWWRQQLCG